MGWFGITTFAKGVMLPIFASTSPTKSDVKARAIQHRGYALIDVLQPCVTFNRPYGYDFYRPRVYDVEKEPGYEPTDMPAAWQRSLEWGDRIPIGVLYQTKEQPSYEEQVPALAAGPLVKQEFRAWTEADYQALREEYM